MIKPLLTGFIYSIATIYGNIAKGNYLAEFSENNGITIIQVSETVIQESVIGRIFSKLFFDLDEFVTLYFEQLKAQVEK
jgi:hypothetical protein